MTTFWTNKPLPELGDKLQNTPPWREVEIIEYDGDFWCDVWITYAEGCKLRTSLGKNRIFNKPHEKSGNLNKILLIMYIKD